MPESYAEVAAKGPKQSDAEKMPDAVPEILHDDSGVHSIDSLQSPHISSVPSSYADQQLEAEREAERKADEAKQAASDAYDQFSSDAKSFASKAEAEASKFKDEAGKRYSEFKKEAGVEGKKAKKEAKAAGEWADRNKENPVVIGNGVVIAALGAALGYGAYRKHAAGELTWKVAGAWAGVVGLFAVGDYFVSQFFFKKYPPK